MKEINVLFIQISVALAKILWNGGYKSVVSNIGQKMALSAPYVVIFPQVLLTFMG